MCHSGSDCLMALACIVRRKRDVATTAYIDNILLMDPRTVCEAAWQSFRSRAEEAQLVFEQTHTHKHLKH